MKYLNLTRKNQSQRQAIPGANQVRNSDGGYVWEVDGWTKVDRFLLLGTESGTYYINAQKLTQENASTLIEKIKEDGLRVVARIVEVSINALGAKNDPAIFALALAATHGNDETRAAAYAAIPKVCRIGTHLFAFVAACNELRGWGRGLRRAVGHWYTDKTPDNLEYQLLKYQQREGWSNADVLRLAHPKPLDERQKALFKWAVDGEITGDLPLIESAMSLRGLGSTEAAAIVKRNKLPREALPTELLNDMQVWEALLYDMPLTAMLRNLGNLSKCGLLVAGSEAEKHVNREFGSTERLVKAKVHPLAVLNALTVYKSGSGVRGSGSWTAVTSVVDTLNDAFYKCFKNVTPSGKRLLLGLDVSGSMAGTRVQGMHTLDCRQAAAAMALTTIATEDSALTVAFDTGPYPLTLSDKQRLDDVVNLLARTGGGGTDCSAPIHWALKNKAKVDAFVIYTDSETWAGHQHPAKAVEAYRKAMGIDAKLVVVAMAANGYSIGDNADAKTLNVVGLDSAAPLLISQFLRDA